MSRVRLGILLVAGLACAAVALPSAAAAAEPVWLCKPGLADNPCDVSLKTTHISPDGQALNVENVKAAKKPKVDCFYVYPTVSDQKTTNANLNIDPEERSIALYQAARYTRDCRVFAPMYRQVTLQGLTTGGISGEPQEIAYSDVLAAWKNYLKKYNKGRGVVLIGHSQGTFMLRRLVTEQIDPKRKLRKKLVSALLLGGNVTVKAGENVGGDFQHLKACKSNSQLHCVVAFSTFNAAPPSNAIFGRTTEPGLQVLCTNPAKFGGTGGLKSVYPSAPFAPGTTIGLVTGLVGLPQPTVSTPWIESAAYNGVCSSADNANVLQITGLPGAPHLNAIPDASWGLHLTDANVALGNLTDVVRKQAKKFTK